MRILVPQYNQTCIMTIPVLLPNNILHPHRNELESEGAQQFIAALVAYYTTLKGWSSIPVRWYKGMSTPIAMILCLSHSNVLKYTVLTTSPCHNKHIFRLHWHFITWNLFFIMQLLTSENLSSPEGKNWADQLPSWYMHVSYLDLTTLFVFKSLYTSKHK